MFGPLDPTRTQVWSCGGGRQSTAIAALIVQGRLPKPDIAVMVDTQREKSATWRYAEAVLIPELAKVGVALEIVQKSDFATKDLYGGEDGETLLIPAFTTIKSAKPGERGKFSNWCSGEWKRHVKERWLRRVRKVDTCEDWIGFSVDEMKRVATSRSRWQRLRYPLIELVPMRREACVRLVEEMGWPAPPRSACWMCPNQSDDEWREMRERDPEDFAQAVALDHAIRERDPHVFLHSSGVPLDQADLSRNEGQPSLFACDSGMCFV